MRTGPPHVMDPPAPVALSRGVNASMAPTTLGPAHHADSAGSLGGPTRFCPSGPTAGSHCTCAHDRRSALSTQQEAYKYAINTPKQLP